MHLLHKILLNLSVLVLISVVLYAYYTTEYGRKDVNVALAENWSRSLQSDGKSKFGTQGGSQGYTPLPHKAPTALFTGRVSIEDTETPVDVCFIFAKATDNTYLKNNLRTFIRSLLKYSSVPLNIHLISDFSSQIIATGVIEAEVEKNRPSVPIKVSAYNVHGIAEDLRPLITLMQRHFSAKPGTYYSDVLFFLSMGFHRVSPHLKRIIFIDIDTKFKADIKNLFQYFQYFGPETIVGLAPELSPVYRHVLSLYRSQHPMTLLGEPLPKGYPGYNSGVALLDLDRLRESEKYNQALNETSVDYMTKKYNFKGHLGDQDFYTLLGIEYPELLYRLPCGWNRQLCTWWKNHGYQEMFDHYFECKDVIKLYHGNCKSQIPEE